MKRIQILLAEDNRGDVLLVRQALREHGIEHEMHLVEDGEQAIAYVSRIGEDEGVPRPDLILLDLNLPKADGPQILDELRRHPSGEGTPVIVLTSSDAQKDRTRMTEMGIARYFRKPSDFDQFMELGAVIREVVGEKPE